jgi:hypothetical protein
LTRVVFGEALRSLYWVVVHTLAVSLVLVQVERSTVMLGVGLLLLTVLALAGAGVLRVRDTLKKTTLSLERAERSRAYWQRRARRAEKPLARAGH